MTVYRDSQSLFFSRELMCVMSFVGGLCLINFILSILGTSFCLNIYIYVCILQKDVWMHDREYSYISWQQNEFLSMCIKTVRHLDILVYMIMIYDDTHAGYIGIYMMMLHILDTSSGYIGIYDDDTHTGYTIWIYWYI